MRLRTHGGRGHAALLAVLAVYSQQAGSAQSVERPLSSFLYGRSGFGLDSATVSAGYQSLGIAGATLFLPSAFDTRGDMLVSGSATMGWSRAGQRSHVGVTYSPNYLTYVRNPDYNSWNHSGSFTASRRLSQKWGFGGGLGATYSNMEQLMFTPSTFSTAAALPATFENFASELLRRPFTPDQLASALSGSQIADSPSRILFFGTRMFSAAASASLSYDHSSRTALTMTATGTRTQPVSAGRPDFQDPFFETRVLGNTTSTGASISLSHALTPRTQAGVSVDGNRVFSNVQDAYRASAAGFIGRRMGRHWLAQVQGGGGAIIPRRQTVRLPTGMQYLAGGSLAFVTRSHTFLGAANRNFGEQFGIGASSVLNFTGAWRWAPPRTSWGLYASASDQRLQRIGLENIRSWQTAAGVSKAFGRHLSSTVEYAYITYDAQTDLYRRTQQHAIRGSLTWTPRGTTRRPEAQ